MKKRTIFFLLATLVLIFIGIFIQWSFSNHSGIPAFKNKVGIVIHSRTIGGKGSLELYNTLKSNGFEVKVIAIPYYYNKAKIVDVDVEYTKLFDKNDVIFPCGIKEDKKCDALS